MKIVLNPAYPAATILRLSAREFEIFCGIACGETPQQISEKLGICTKTISTYRQRVIDKLGLKSNQEMAVLAYQQGITKVEDEIQANGQEEIPLQKRLDFEAPEASETGSGDTEGFSRAIGNHAGEVESETTR